MENMEKKYTHGKLAYSLLLLISAGVLIPAAIVAPNSLKVFLPFFKKLTRRLKSDSYRVRRSLVTMKNNRLVKTELRKGETVFIITEEGKKRIARGEFEKLKISVPQKWDKKWRMVLFDIPEEHKDAREALRLKLIELGFYKLQKSCFIYPFECRNEVDFVTEFFGVSQFTNYLLVESLEGERQLCDYFNL